MLGWQHRIRILQTSLQGKSMGHRFLFLCAVLGAALGSREAVSQTSNSAAPAMSAGAGTAVGDNLGIGVNVSTVGLDAAVLDQRCELTASR
jgi:hypothetical protein